MNFKYFIVFDYPEITGSNEILKHIVGEVVEIGVTDSICVGVLSARIQDIIVQIGKAKFRTCSKFVATTQNNFTELLNINY